MDAISNFNNKSLMWLIILVMETSPQPLMQWLTSQHLSDQQETVSLEYLREQLIYLDMQDIVMGVL